MRNRYFGDKAFYKMTLLVAIPIMIQNGITNFVSLLDNIMVGRVGTVEMTGVSIVNTLLFVFNLTIFGAVSGAGIFTAQFFGKEDHEGIRYTLRYKLIISVLLTVLGVTVFLLFGEPLIMLYLRGEGEAENITASLLYAKRYLRIMLVGLAPFAIVQCYSGTLRETGETSVPMWAGIAAVCVNLFFNYLLIFGKFGMPKLGVEGAAIATVLSRFVELAIIAIWTHRHVQKNPFITGTYRSMYIPRDLVKHITTKGLPLLVNETLWAGGMALLSQSYSVRGYMVVSALNISNTIVNVFNVAFLAMGNAVGIIVGQLLGAGKNEEAKGTVRKLITFSVLLSAGVAMVMAAFSGLFPKAYNTDASIRSLATGFILSAAVFMPVNAFANASYFTLRSGGKTLITFLFDSFFVCVVSVPVAYVLSRFTSIPIIPLYIAVQALDLIKCILGYILIKKGIWIHNIVETKEGAQ